MNLIRGDCLEILKTLPDNSIDSLITDPPAGIQFMGLEFDHHKGGRDEWVAWLREILEECKRVMKPGAIGFVWSLPRTQHWTALACEDAGFLIWDNLGVAHVQAGGFPKGQDIGKMLDEQQWDGWKMKSLKPAIEFWIAIQKPHKGTCIDNIREWGVGGINIDATRVKTGDDRTRPPRSSNNIYGGGKGSDLTESISNPNGRYPANYIQIHSPRCSPDECAPECPCRMLGAQSGIVTALPDKRTRKQSPSFRQDVIYGSGWGKDPTPNYSDTGTAARYFHQFDPPFTYQPKASPRDRNDGTAHLLWRRDGDSSIGWEPCTLAEYEALNEGDRAIGNIHATVKSTQLMEFFVKLATPIGGTVLDPFMGSGTTGVAAAKYGAGFIGIEREPHYFRIAEARINQASTPYSPMVRTVSDAPRHPPVQSNGQLSLFDAGRMEA